MAQHDRRDSATVGEVTGAVRRSINERSPIWLTEYTADHRQIEGAFPDWNPLRSTTAFIVRTTSGQRFRITVEEET